MANTKAAKNNARSTVADQAAAPKAGHEVTKGKAIVAALRHLGKEASTKDVIGYALQKFGVEVCAGYIFRIKSQLKKKRAEKKAAEPEHRPNGELATNTARRGRPPQAGCSMSVLRQLKELSQQAGGMNKLKQLVNLLAD